MHATELGNILQWLQCYFLILDWNKKHNLHSYCWSLLNRACKYPIKCKLGALKLFSKCLRPVLQKSMHWNRYHITPNLIEYLIQSSKTFQQKGGICRFPIWTISTVYYETTQNPSQPVTNGFGFFYRNEISQDLNHVVAGQFWLF